MTATTQQSNTRHYSNTRELHRRRTAVPTAARPSPDTHKTHYIKTYYTYRPKSPKAAAQMMITSQASERLVWCDFIGGESEGSLRLVRFFLPYIRLPCDQVTYTTRGRMRRRPTPKRSLCTHTLGWSHWIVGPRSYNGSLKAFHVRVSTTITTSGVLVIRTVRKTCSGSQYTWYT